MCWWQRALGVAAVAAAIAFVMLWALREVNVIRWGAAGAALDRIEAVQERIDVLEQQASQGGPEFIVVNTDVQSTGAGSADACMTYSAPGGAQERCFNVHLDDGGELTDASQRVRDCFGSAVIGEPLPACWRGN